MDCFSYVDYIFFHCRLVPAINPHILLDRTIDYSKSWIRWEKLSPKYVRGILRGYRIYFAIEDADKDLYEYSTVVGNITVGPGILEMTITGLQPNTYYLAWVKAFTSKGEGRKENIEYIRTSKLFLCSR